MINALLIANRGEIAVRIIRTAHRLGVATVAVYSDPDADAPHVALADLAVRLPGATSAETYLRGEAIIEAARATGADAIHPGYGFLSENAAFAADVVAAGLTFVGPSPEAIAAMGSKIAAKARMEAAGVPVLPGGEVTADADLDALAARIDYPLLVKAAYGGGGRGMRRVDSPVGLAEAVDAAGREASAAFGDGTVSLERYVVDPRHVEVQIVGDTHGTVTHLFERECSIQRRYQKIVEESPSPAVDRELRAALGSAAITAGEAIGYVGAGTVEFVLDPAGRFFFLEMNTRLQVEHPVTELVTGIDLVEVQLRVAAGEPLSPEVRHARMTGHAIEVRLYAEDVAAGFRPATGTLHRFDLPVPAGGRVDAGYRDGSVVGPYYDAMLAKIIGYGRTRTDAARHLQHALRQARVHGVTTNRDLLIGILTEPEFQAGITDTGYLTRHDPAELAASAATDPPAATVSTGTAATATHALVAAIARAAGNRAEATVLGTIPSGWRNVRSDRNRCEYAAGDRILRVAYHLDGVTVDATVDDAPVGPAIRVLSACADRVVWEVDRVRQVHEVHRVAGTDPVEVYVDGPRSSSALVEVPRFPEPSATVAAGSLLAPMPGLVVEVRAAAGDTVAAGTPLVVLEAMKMRHTVSAPTDGVVTEIGVVEGDQVEGGQILAVLVTAGEPETVGERGSGDA